MAKGNIGNLLQHFVALEAGRRLLKAWSKPSEPIEYIDCYSTAPWEPADCANTQGYLVKIGQFEKTAQADDLTAKTFIDAWTGRYGAPLPPIREREYPNTVVLLRTAFPDQAWNWRLHEIEEKKRVQLEALIGAPVEADWKTSTMIRNRALPADRPSWIMLDPKKILRKEKPNDDGSLASNWLRYLCGTLALDVNGATIAAAPPRMLTIFSYSDKDDLAEEVVQEAFGSYAWRIHRVRSGPHGRATYHQAWVITNKSCGDAADFDLQPLWDKW